MGLGVCFFSVCSLHRSGSPGLGVFSAEVLEPGGVRLWDPESGTQRQDRGFLLFCVFLILPCSQKDLRPWLEPG